MLQVTKTCGEHGGITSEGTPCTRKEFWGMKEGIPYGEVPGRCVHHRVGIFLSPYEKRFVDAYCGSAKFNQTRAAMAAGACRKTSAHVIGHGVFYRPNVQAAVKRRLEALAMSEAEITARFSEIGRGDLNHFLTFDESRGTFDINLSTPEAQAFMFLLKKIKQTEEVIESSGEGDDFRYQRRTEIELHDVLKALDSLAKVRGMMVSKHELTGKDGGPIETLDISKARERFLRRVAGVASRIGTTSDYPGYPGNGGRGS